MMIGSDEIRQALESVQEFQICWAWFAALAELFGATGAGGAGAAAAAPTAASAAAAPTAASVTAAPTAAPTAASVTGPPTPVGGTAPTAVNVGATTPTPMADISTATSAPIVDISTEAAASSPELNAFMQINPDIPPMTSGNPNASNFDVGTRPAGIDPIMDAIDKIRSNQTVQDTMELHSNLQEIKAQYGEPEIPRHKVPQSPQDQTPLPTPPNRVPELSRARTVDFGDRGGGFGFDQDSPMAQRRAQAVRELIADLRLNRRSFG